MSNYVKVAYEDAEGDLKAIYDDAKTCLGVEELPNWMTYLGEVPHVLNGVWAHLKGILLKGHLSPLLQDLIMFTVSYHRTVPYCMALHGSNLIRMTKGLTFDDLRQIARGESRGFIPNKYAIATELAAKLAVTDCSLREEDFKRLEDAGFDRIQVLEITQVISFTLFLNTYTFAANLPIDESLQVPNYAYGDGL